VIDSAHRAPHRPRRPSDGSPASVARLVDLLDPSDGLAVDSFTVGAAVGELVAAARTDTRVEAWIVEHVAVVADALALVSHGNAGRALRLGIAVCELLAGTVIACAAADARQEREP
jgi:hypothetical protein